MENTIFRKAVREDMPQLMQIYEDAKSTLRQQGVPQWQDGYPNEQVIGQDIDLGRFYVLILEDHVIAGTVLSPEPDENYQNIDGAWLTDGPSIVIHRIAVAKEYKGKNAASVLVKHAIAMAREYGCVSLRVDTHRNNRSMRRLLEKNSFRLCGVIRLASVKKPGPLSDPLRVAYELPLSQED